MEPSIAIIIVNWNGLKDTVECIHSLKKISYANYEIILVDNGSEDGSVNYLEGDHCLSVRLIKNKENLGFTGGNNIGIQIAIEDGFDYILLLNNDTLIEDTDFLTKMVQPLESDKEVGFACPTILYNEPYGKVWYAGGEINLWKGWRHFYDLKDKNVYTGFTTGCCLLVRRDCLLNIGLLNNYYFLSVEDVEWCEYAKRTGWKLMHIASTSIIHKDSVSSGCDTGGTYSPARVFYEFRNSIFFVREYATLAQKVLAWSMIFGFKFIYRSAGYIVLKKWDKFKALRKAFWEGVFTPGSKFKMRTRNTS